jgi:hypothetical protein
MHTEHGRPQLIYSADHAIVNRSRNLAGVRRYVRTHAIAELHIAQRALGQTGGWLYLVFQNGASFQTTFADYRVLAGFVLRWRAVYGTELWIGGHKQTSTISAKHPSLVAIARGR